MSRFIFTILLWAVLSNLASGQSWQWVKQLTQSPNPNLTDELDIYDFKLSSTNNLYILGSFRTTFTLEGTTYPGDASNKQDIFLIKTDTDGNISWVRTAGSTGNENPQFLDLDASENIYIVGGFQSTCSFSGTPITAAGTKFDGFIAKYNSSGTIQWAKRVATGISGDDNDRITGIAINSTGTLFVTGLFKSTQAQIGDGGVNDSTFTNSDTNPDLFLASYDSDGNFNWARQYVCNTNNSIFRSMSIGTQGNVYFGGALLGTITIGSTNYTSKGSGDIILVKANPTDGDTLWVRTGGGASDDQLNHVTVSDDNVYISGYVQGTGTIDSTDVLQSSYTTVGGTDFFVARYNIDGRLIWKKNLGSAGSDNSYGISVRENIVLTTGFFSNSVTFNTKTVTSGGGFDTGFFVFDTDGNPITAESVSGGAEDKGQGIAYDDQGNVYVGGYFMSSSLTVGATTLTNSSSPSTTYKDVFFAKYHNPFSVTKVHSKNVTCNGGSNGEITVTPYFGKYPYTYVWTKDGAPFGDTDSVLTGLSSGTYAVTVTDDNAEVATTSYTVTQPTAISVSEAITNVSCFNKSDGAIAITVSNGNSPYTFYWTSVDGSGHVEADEDQTGLTAGTYSLIVTDEDTCTYNDDYVVTEPSQISIPGVITNITDPGSNGEVNITPSGGSGTYASYSWKDESDTEVATTQDLSGVNFGGNYEVIVTDNTTCKDSVTFNVVDERVFDIWISSSTNINCKGDATGAATVSYSGNVGTVTFDWSSGETTASISGKVAATYTVDVTDDKGTPLDPLDDETLTENITLTEPAAVLSGSIVPTHVTCFGGSNGVANLTPSGGTPSYSYSWDTSPVQTTQDISGLVAGDYEVTITDSKGCTYITSTTITQPNDITYTVDQTQPTCYGGINGSLTVSGISGGTPGYTYLWSTTQTTSSISGIGAGAYWVRVIDSKSCYKQTNINLGQPSAITVSHSQNNPTCPESTNGSIGITVSGGTGAKTYFWTGPGITNPTDEDQTGLGIGTYEVEVTDANSCTKNYQVILTAQNPSPTAGLTSSDPDNEICDGDAVTFTASGGSTYEFFLNSGSVQGPGAATNYSTSGLNNGDQMYVEVTSAAGCMSTSSIITTTVNSLPVVNLDAFADVCIDASPFALSGGSPLGGNYTGTGVSGSDFDPVTAGVGTHTITYTYTDGNGCINSFANDITVNSLPTVTLGVFADVCIDAAPFALTGGNPTGGNYTGPGVSGGNFDPAAANAGTHTITYTYTDGNGCDNSATSNITVNSLPVVTLGAFADVCIDDTPFALTGGNPTGGNYTGTGVSGGNFDPTSAGAGNHTITYTYTDGNGCDNSATSSILVASALSGGTIASNQSICSGGDPAAFTSSADPSGGLGSWTYSWESKVGAGSWTAIPGATGLTYDVPSGLTTTTSYQRVATNDCGTTYSNTITVTVKSLPTAAIVPSGTQSICNGSSIGLNANTGLGYTYKWYKDALLIPGETTSTLVVSEAADYYAEVTSAVTGCSNTSNTTTIQVKPVPTASISTTDNLVWCADDVVDVTFTAVDEPGATYQWYRNGNGLPGATSKTYIAHLAGTYDVMVTLNECASTSNSIEVVVNPLPVSTISTTDPLVYCADVPVNTTLQASPLADSYQWYLDGTIILGATADNYVATQAGDYTVDIVLVGCDAISDITTIVVNPLPTVTLDNFTPVCIDANPITLSGGLPVAGTYSGNGVVNGVLTPSDAGVGTTTITYTYTDGNGCTNFATSDMIVNDLPVVTIGSFADICLNADPLALSGGTPVGGSYSGTGIMGDTFTPSTAGVGIHTITYSYTDGNGCTNTASTTITVLDIPTVTLDVFADMCIDASPITLSGGLPVGGVYSIEGNVETIFDPFAAGTGIHSIIYTYTDGNNCTNETSQTITVYSLPVVNIVTTDPLVYCEGDAISTAFTASPAGADSYQWLLNGSNIDGATSETYTAATDGSYSVVVTVNGCPATSSETEITATPLPIVSIGTTDPLFYCEGETISTTFTAQPSGADSYQWLLNGSAISGAIAESFLADAGGNYAVEVMLNGCSSVSTESIIIVKPNPGTFISADKLNYCEGETINTTFTALPAGADSYEWKLNGVVIDGATTDTYLASEVGFYTVTAFHNGCSDISPDSVIEMHAIPEVSIYSSDPLSYCEGQTINTSFSAVSLGDETYQWLLAGLPIDGATSESLNVTTAGIYSVIATSEFGCSATSAETTVEINAYPDPVITTSDPLEYCEGETINTILTAEPAGDYTYHWYLNGDAIDGATNQTYTATAVGNYMVIVYSGICSTFSLETTISTKPLPTFTVSTTDPTTYCEGESINTTYRVQPSDAGTYQWFIDGVPVDGATADAFNVTSSGVVNVQVSADGCSATSEDNIIVITPLPVVSINTTDPVVYCEGESFNIILTAEPAGAEVYQWYKDDVLIDGETNQTYTATDFGSYSVEATVNGCSAISAEIAISMNDVPVVSIITTDPIAYCEGISINTIFTAQPSGADSYQWLLDGQPIIGESNDSYTATAVGSYSVEATKNGCSATSDDVNIVQVTQPTVNLGNDITACGSTTLDAGNPGGTFLWNTTATTQTITVTQSGTYSVTVSYQGGCSGNDQIDVTINPLPQVVLATDTIRINTQETYTLDAGAGFASYLWSDATTNQTLFVDGTIMTPGIYSYWVEVTDNNSCSNRDTAVVKLTLWDNIITDKQWTIEMYPNPTSGDFILNVAGIKSGKAQISIYNASGVLLQTKPIIVYDNEIRELIDISNYNKGFYLIRISDGKNYITKKIMLE